MTGRTSFFLDAILTYQLSLLFNDFGNDAGADGETAFTDGELGALLQRHRHDQLHRQVDIIPGITISTPSGRVMLPVTSIVRM